MERVTGIGGVFFRGDDDAALSQLVRRAPRRRRAARPPTRGRCGRRRPGPPCSRRSDRSTRRARTSGRAGGASTSGCATSTRWSPSCRAAGIEVERRRRGVPQRSVRPACTTRRATPCSCGNRRDDGVAVRRWRSGLPPRRAVPRREPPHRPGQPPPALRHGRRAVARVGGPADRPARRRPGARRRVRPGGALGADRGPGARRRGADAVRPVAGDGGGGRGQRRRRRAVRGGRSVSRPTCRPCRSTTMPTTASSPTTCSTTCPIRGSASPSWRGSCGRTGSSSRPRTGATTCASSTRWRRRCSVPPPSTARSTCSGPRWASPSCASGSPTCAGPVRGRAPLHRPRRRARLLVLEPTGRGRHRRAARRARGGHRGALRGG